jgi:hypothetical protein
MKKHIINFLPGERPLSFYENVLTEIQTTLHNIVRETGGKLDRLHCEQPLEKLRRKKTNKTRL